MRSADACRSRSSVSTPIGAQSRRGRSKERRISTCRRTSSAIPHRRRWRRSSMHPRRPLRKLSSPRPWTQRPRSTRRRPKKHPLLRTKHPLPPSPFPTSTNAKRPLAVAITGGIGAGKSAALEAFARHGAATRSSDEIVHRLLSSDPEVRRELVERFGPEVIGSDGADRAVIARIVFNNPEHLDWLEELLHPRVVQEHSAWSRQLAAGPDPPAVTVTEVPLLYETGGEKRFDIVVAITAPPDVRAKRKPIADERERRLLAEDEKVRLADYTYVNDRTLEELDTFVAGVLADLAT